MQEHERWLKIVDEDLKSAKGLLKIEVFSTANYHCQQAAEKVLKAYLVFKNYKTIKTHVSTRFRYPTEFDVPGFEDTKNSIRVTQKIINFVRKKIAEPDTGQKELF